MNVVLDAGALIAIDKRNRKVGAILRLLQRDQVVLRTSAGAVAQVWRSGARQANLARVLCGLDVVAVDETDAKSVGELLAVNETNDLVDAHVALLVEPEGTVLTSDVGDIDALLQSRRVEATVLRV